jgi:hypothetical protein
VSIDLWLAYKNLVRELMPSAEVVAIPCQVEIYRQDRTVEVLDFSTTLSGEDVLSGFILCIDLACK